MIRFDMLRLPVAAAALCAVMAFAAPAVARDLPSGGLTAEQVAGWLKDKGYSAEIETGTDGKNDKVVYSAVDGVTFGIYFYGCKGDVCTAIQYAAGWDDGVSLEKVNQWNRDYRYLRTYLTESGKVFCEYDVDIAPGGTWEQLDESLKTWGDALQTFLEVLGE